MPDPNRLSASDPQQMGAYRLVGVLGEGGQGTVYLGQAPSGRRVAVKVLHTRMAAEAAVRERFEREAALARRVAVFCTAQILEAGVSEGRPYLVSEYVPGPSLQQLVAGEGPRTGSGLERLAVATATALAAIHRVGIVHRDFKPANVIMGPEGPVVIDFGIARILEAGVTSSALVGSPGYMAPEQLSDQPAGPAADMFAWAATMVYAATGHAAFTGQHPAAVMNAVMGGEPDLNGVPRGLWSLLAACLAKEPTARPTADQVLTTLTGHGASPGSNEGNGSRRGNHTASAPSSGMTAARNTSGRDRVPADRRPGAPVRIDPDDVTRYGTPGEHGGSQGPPSSGPSRAGAHPFPRQPDQAAEPDANPSSKELPSPDRRRPPVSGIRQGGPVPTAPSGWSAGALALPTASTRRRIPVLVAATAAAVTIGVIAGVALYSQTAPTDMSSSPAGTAAASATPSTAPPDPAPASTELTGPVLPKDVVLPSKPLTGHIDSINTVAVAQLNGSPIIVSGSADNTIRIWNLSTGKQIGEPLIGHSRSISTVAVTQLNGFPAIISSSTDNTIRIWDLSTGEQLDELITKHTYGIHSMAVSRLNGRPVAVSVGSEDAMYVWDLTTGKQIGEPYTINSYASSTRVVVGQVNGRPVAVSGGGDAVQVWDLTTGRQMGQTFENIRRAKSLAVMQIDDRPIIISGDDKTVRLWDLASGRPIGQPFTGHTFDIIAVARAQLDGRPVILSASWDRTVRVWDPTTGQQVGKSFTHPHEVTSMAVAQLGDRPIVVSGGYDKAIRVWDLTSLTKGG
ncbi:serine/threonine-protein kinase [Planomonospora sp. ID82291]|uniref:serine/threonine-protein kinase n=1 Tax=Planomonospora sp. ID82291 TaxID=2738136 RepID=UPI0018C414B5|nr:serine/threonine-protein kinase [Planomonospora sp. ID82291]MBG0813437.1 protein kinase [Planomonospora sp. ID82291]